MTKAEQVRTAVLEAIENGASEAEAARAAGVEEERVQKILDSLEWEPPPPPVQTEKKIPLPRTKSGINPYKVQPHKKPQPRKKIAPKPGNPRRARLGGPDESASSHGTESGYSNLHTKYGLPPCDECREAMKQRAERRRHAKRISFSTEEEAILYLSGVNRRMDIFRCTFEDCRSWHVISPNQQTMSREERLARRKTWRMRDKRRKALTTVPTVR